MLYPNIKWVKKIKVYSDTKSKLSEVSDLKTKIKNFKSPKNLLYKLCVILTSNKIVVSNLKTRTEKNLPKNVS